MTQQQTSTQPMLNFAVKTEGLTTASILTTNTSANFPPTVSISAPAQTMLGAVQAASGGQSIAAAAAKNDPKAVEQSVAKLKQFLKNLVKLAEGRKKEVQDKVQSHVQRLLAGALSEEQFAENLENDLNSPHQPNLLPFLKASVPHLRATLLHQRLLMDKQQQLLDFEKQKTAAASAAALLVSQSKTMVTAGLNNNNAKVNTATSLSLPTTTAAALPTMATTQSLNLAQALLQSMSPDKQQQLIAQKQALQQLLQKQAAAQLKKEALDAVTSVTASEPDIQITGVSRSAKSTSSQILNLSNQLARTNAASSSLLTYSSSKFSPNKPVTSLANGTSLFNSNISPAAAKLLEAKSKGKTLMRGKTKKDFATFGDNSDDDDENMEVAGVNLQEEAVHFLPPSAIESDTSDKKIEDALLLHKDLLKQKILGIGRSYGVTMVSDEAISQVSHATEYRLKNLLSKLAVISQHRTEVLKDDDHYEVTSQVREQLRFLESIDRVHTKRKQEQERERLLKAAKSKSKSDDPNLIRIKEQAKQLQKEELEQIRTKAANETALLAIGARRKRPAANSSESQLSSATGSSLGVLTGSQPKHKRRVAIRDLAFLMEQERETRKSPLFYKILMK